jgi:hypothetical protein
MSKDKWIVTVRREGQKAIPREFDNKHKAWVNYLALKGAAGPQVKVRIFGPGLDESCGG